jgi:hypothetical protein
MQKKPRVPAKNKIAAKAAKRTLVPLRKLGGALGLRRAPSAKSPEHAARRAAIKKALGR